MDWLAADARDSLRRLAGPAHSGRTEASWAELISSAVFKFEVLLDLAACSTPVGVPLSISPNARLSRALAANVLAVRPSLASDCAHRLHGTAEMLCNVLGRVSAVL